MIDVAFIVKALNTMLPPILKIGFISAVIFSNKVQLPLRKAIFIKNLSGQINLKNFLSL